MGLDGVAVQGEIPWHGLCGGNRKGREDNDNEVMVKVACPRNIDKLIICG